MRRRNLDGIVVFHLKPAAIRSKTSSASSECNARMETASPPLSLAIVGCGRVVEQCHLPALRTLSGLKVVALVDNNPGRLNEVANQLGVQRRFTDYRTMLDEAGVDAVAVCAPPQFHAAIGLAVLDAGKHLFVEKPLALSLKDADQLVDRAAAAPGKALAGFNLRWHRLVRQARSMIDGGSLGPLASMHTTFTSATAFPGQGSPWRRRPDLGGSVLFDLGIHHFDLWRFLTQCEVREVFAYRRTDGSGVESVTVSAMMANGVPVTSSFSHGVSDTNELEICGRKARLRMSCYRFDSLHLENNAAAQGAVRNWLNAAMGAARKLPQAAARLRRGGDIGASYRAQWQHFIDAIRNDTPIQSDFEQGRHALQVTLAAVESNSCGRPVRVAEAAHAITPLIAAAPPNRIVGRGPT
jgi:myo-inositol 2-dehydrogenase/D-chiro-inositol 1-dehydrogenase